MSVDLRLRDRAQDQIRPVVDRNYLHALRQPRLHFADLRFHAPDHIERVLALPHDDDARDRLARAVQVRYAAPQFGPQRHLAHVLHADRSAGVARHQHGLFEVTHRPGIPAPAHHVLGAAEFEQPPASLAVPRPHGLHHAADRNPVSLQPVRVNVHLELFAEAAHRRHLRHARNGLQVIAQVPVLARAQLRQVVLPRVVHQHVLENPSQARRVRPHLRLHAGGQARLHRGEIFERARARPVDIRTLLEDDVDVGVAEIGEAAHRLHLRRAEHGRDDRIGNLVLHNVGAAVPAREDDHLRIAEVGDGVERNGAQRPVPAHGGGGREQDHQEAVPRGEVDDPVDHCPDPVTAAMCPPAGLFR